jgi:hypothetical protein
MGYSKKNMSINWGKGEHRDLMEKAIHDWHKMSGNINKVKVCHKCYEFAKTYRPPPPKKTASASSLIIHKFLVMEIMD